MNEFRYTLLPDGPADRALLPILTWVLRHHLNAASQPAWADLRRLPRPPRNLDERIEKSVDLYPCDLLFVHRDAEREAHDVRIDEIRQAIARIPDWRVPTVCLVPVRMQEAWLLFDDVAIRHAAGNPNGRQVIRPPSISTVEDISDPKELLASLLRSASGLTGRQLKQFNVPKAAARVAEFIDDFSPLRLLPAFSALEVELEGVIQAQGW